MLHLCTVEVRGQLFHRELLRVGKYAHVSHDVTEQNFPLDSVERAVRNMALLDAAVLGREVKTVAVEALLLEKRLRPATVTETLTWGYQHPPLLPVPPEGYLHAVALNARNVVPDKDGYSVLCVATYEGSSHGQTLTTRRYNATTWQTSRYLFLCVAL